MNLYEEVEIFGRNSNLFSLFSWILNIKLLSLHRKVDVTATRRTHNPVIEGSTPFLATNVLKYIETYNHHHKYKDIGTGQPLKICLNPVWWWFAVRDFLVYRFRYSFSGNRIQSPIASLTHKERSQQSFADSKSNNLLNHGTGCFKTHLPAMSQSRELKLNGGKDGEKLSF